ncbi:nuclear transport factor 2 family protein [Gordonia McavH-238-E]|uniref:nuclear transport factor 2 family protein n=1 Tax=Gordonia sp. McavH-238-E TaxID=2917736 RepID=UPI001EF4B666|nr:nuclear transport factor 2 family protein [Gordonia sp. McavH-238-E]MCG7632817.1 nuclear transport factor 2 family protein [Gordonia sp. McavH-238-E]
MKTFYSAMANGDVPLLERVIAEDFAAAATLARPESLPGGGVLNGPEAIVGFLRRAAGKAPLVVDDISVADDGSRVFATVTITLGGTKSTALEQWTMDDGKVTSIRAYYWDTAAMLGPSRD